MSAAEQWLKHNKRYLQRIVFCQYGSKLLLNKNNIFRIWLKQWSLFLKTGYLELNIHQSSILLPQKDTGAAQHIPKSTLPCD